jgi:diguanylate cyclase (GGDEF)-like protein
VYFFLMGVAGGAVATYAAHPVASAVSIVMLMVPATVVFAFSDMTELRVLAAGGVLYLGAALRSIRTFGFFLRRTYQLSFELHQAWDRAHDQARTDELTGLPNRRAFVERGTAALDQARRYHRPLSLVMFDIDHFKKINDTLGHAAGDATLRAAAVVVQRTARAADVTGRIGGEEFAILLPETAALEAAILAERLRRDLAAVALTHEGHEIRFTCSFGVAECGAGTAKLDQLLDAADGALYAAKAAGRNRVRTAGSAAPEA